MIFFIIDDVGMFFGAPWPTRFDFIRVLGRAPRRGALMSFAKSDGVWRSEFVARQGPLAVGRTGGLLAGLLGWAPGCIPGLRLLAAALLDSKGCVSGLPLLASACLTTPLNAAFGPARVLEENAHIYLE